MIKFKEKTAEKTHMSIPLKINNLKFFDMNKTTTKNPVSKRSGVKNSCIYSLSETYNL